jgi:hypothetical protein
LIDQAARAPEKVLHELRKCETVQRALRRHAALPGHPNAPEYARCVARLYRRDFWDQQPHRVQVWSEKGTLRGVLRPVLDNYAVGFFPVHGFTSATAAHAPRTMMAAT